MIRLIAIWFLASQVIASGVGLGPTCPAVHAVAGFMPTQLRELRFWMDANRAGFTNNTTNINYWQDFSGRGVHSYQDVDMAYRPKMGTGLNGRPGIVFDGTNDYMTPSTWPTLPTNGVGFVMMLAVASGAGTNSQYPLMQGFQYLSDPPEPGTWAFILNETDSRSYSANSVNPFFQNVSNGSGSGGAVKSFINNPPVMFMYMNNVGGTSNGKIYSKGTAIDTFSLAFCFDTYVWIGAKSPNQGFFEGSVVEIFITGRGLNDAELLQAERYMRTKYGIVEKQ